MIEFIPGALAVGKIFCRNMLQTQRTIFGFFISSRQPGEATISRFSSSSLLPYKTY